jgi:hypothetical protein
MARDVALVSGKPYITGGKAYSPVADPERPPDATGRLKQA